MRQNELTNGIGALLGATLIAVACAPSEVRVGTTSDWPMYRGDRAGTGYSALAEITPANVADLTAVWSYPLERDAAGAASGQAAERPVASQATPIVTGGVMYLPAADRVVALDPSSGAEIWRHPVEGGAPSQRGVAYWPGGDGTPARIFFTSGRRLIAVDAASGAPALEFGAAGEVDMVVPYISVPFVYDDIIVVGANTPPGTGGGIGNARAYDARTGAKIWEFSSVPQPGHVGHETWEGESWRGRLGANAWPFFFTMDEERELLYLPLASPVPGAYGGDRGGANLFGNAVVAVNVRTGAYVWHFQTIHHDIWDADPPAPPVLFDAAGGGETIPALGVTTKSGYIYILNRATGEPIFGVEERPVPASDVPGERIFPTQPIPVRPPALARVRFNPADLVMADQTSPEHVQACLELMGSVGEIRNDGPFTPWVYRSPAGPDRATLLFPGLVGGPNWGGAAFDPSSGYLFVFSQDLGSFGWVQDTEPGSPVPYERSGPQPATFDVPVGRSRWPCQKPPWGQLTAIDGSSGEVAWTRHVGITEGLPPEKQNTGRPGRAGAIVTGSGLLFIAATDDNRFRAIETVTGREAWVTEMPGRGNANPITFLGGDGRQYVAVSATDRIVAFRLP